MTCMGLQNLDGYDSKALMAIPRDAREWQEEKVVTLGMSDTVYCVLNG